MAEGQVTDTDPITGDPTSVAGPPQKPPEPNPYEIYQQGEARVDKTAAKVEELGAERRKEAFTPLPRTPPPDVKDIGPPPQASYQNVFKQAMNPLIFLTAMGAGMMSKNHGMGAMKAATGFMEGFQEGDKNRIELEQLNWKNNMARLVENNKNAVDRYNAVLRNNSLTAVEKQAHIQAISAEIYDTMALETQRSGNQKEFFNLLASRERAVTQLQTLRLRHGEDANYSDEAIRFMAEQYTLGGDKSSFTGLTRSPIAMAKFRNEIVKVAKDNNMSPAQVSSKLAEFEGYKAFQRVLSNREANLGLQAQELVSFAGPALEASQRVPRGNFVPINRIAQNAKTYLSDPDLREFYNRNAGLITAYAGIIGRNGGITVHAQQRAELLLNTAEGQEAYQRAVDTLVSEADLAEKAPDILRRERRELFTGERSEQPRRTAPSPRAGAGQPAGPQKELYYDNKGNFINDKRSSLDEGRIVSDETPFEVRFGQQYAMMNEDDLRNPGRRPLATPIFGGPGAPPSKPAGQLPPVEPRPTLNYQSAGATRQGTGAPAKPQETGQPAAAPSGITRLSTKPYKGEKASDIAARSKEKGVLDYRSAGSGPGQAANQNVGAPRATNENLPLREREPQLFEARSFLQRIFDNTKGMNRQEILDSEAMWGGARRLSESGKMSFKDAFHLLIEQRTGYGLAPTEWAKIAQQAMEYGIR